MNVSLRLWAIHKHNWFFGKSSLVVLAHLQLEATSDVSDASAHGKRGWAWMEPGLPNHLSSTMPCWLRSSVHMCAGLGSGTSSLSLEEAAVDASCLARLGYRVGDQSYQNKAPVIRFGGRGVRLHDHRATLRCAGRDPELQNDSLHPYTTVSKPGSMNYAHGTYPLLLPQGWSCTYA